MVHAEPGISSFLKARRAALDPADLGLPSGLNRRRVSGLRREEVAQLAGISVDYYTRIEQGRANAISDSVLDAVARALRLSDGEVTYLRNVTAPPRRTGPDAAQRVRPETRQLLDAMDDTVPAMVLGRGLDILAWNALGGRVSFPLDEIEPERRNSAMLLFLDPRARELYPDWERAAQESVGTLRAEAGRHPHDPRMCRLLGELIEHSAHFKRLWEAQEVHECLTGTKRIHHPQVGELLITFQSFRLPADPDQVLLTYTAPGHSPTAGRLRELARLARPALVG